MKEQATANTQNLSSTIFKGSILWAIDPSNFSKDVLHQTEAFLEAFLGRRKFPLEIVVVEDPDGHKDRAGSEQVDRRFLQIENLRSIVELERTNAPLKIHELPVHSTHIGEKVNTLIELASKAGASLIVVGNRGHSWLKRIISGSFSETLILRSPIPVLVIGSHAHPHSSIKQILVPTDFTQEDRHIFLKAVDLARPLAANIILFHGVPDELNTSLDFSGPASKNYVVDGQIVDFFTYRDAMIRKKKDQAQSWLEDAWLKNVDAQFEIKIVVEQNKYMLDQVIKDVKPDLIMLETRSSPLKAVVMGSIGRHLAREASCPVLIYSPLYFSPRTGSFIQGH